MPKKKVTKAKKAKAGKGKKDGKQESKVDRETDMEKARSNAALWELRLQVTEQSLTQYRESCRRLARANEELTNDLYRVEKDSVDTTWFFNKQLDDASRSVFRENVRLNEALKLHLKETQELGKQNKCLTEQNDSLIQEKGIIKKNAAHISFQQEERSKLQSKVASLEEALKQKESQFKEEEAKQKQMLVCVEAGQVELDKLQKVLSMREKELVHIKKLAAVVVEQRTELERFFHQALAEVKQEATVSRSKYKKDALQAYRMTLREANRGKVKFPPIRNFHRAPHSTNSVYSDMEAAPGSKVEISDLTWEQKEHVLRHLFAKMNGVAESYNTTVFQNERGALSSSLHHPGA
uniref:Si:ch211-243o19.4 n=1 Tax=Neogobius melanostomus TaxID=47308 RepID=A0A8C6T2D4_9GOBI